MRWFKRFLAITLITVAFSSTAMALSTPTLSINKTTAMVNENFTLSWNSISGATSYTIQYSNYADFGTWWGDTVTGTSKTYYSPDPLTYYFRVCANDDYTGESSNFSNVKSIVITDTVPGDPTDDLYIYSKSCDTAYVDQEFCCAITLENSGDICYAIDEVDLDRDSGPSIIWSDKNYTTDFTLCANQTKTMSGFCATASSSGTLYINMDVSVSSDWYNNLDIFHLTINNAPCNNECSSGEIGCNGTTQRWSCGESGDGDSCLDKIFTNCPSGYVCSAGSCILSCDQCSLGQTGCLDANTSWWCQQNVISGCWEQQPYQSCAYGCSGSGCLPAPDQEPVLSDLYYDPSTDIIVVKYTDQDGDWPSFMMLLLYDSQDNHLGSYNMDLSVGTNPISGLWYSIDMSFIADGFYYYWIFRDGPGSNLYPSVGKASFEKKSCLDDCTVGQTGCSSSTQQWSCGEANDSDTCLDKIYTNCQTGYACSSGSCFQIPPPNPPVLSASVSTASSGQNYTLSWTATGSAYRVDESQSPSFTSYLSWSNGFTTQIFSHQPSSTTTYYYRVLAIDPITGLKSNPSNIVSVTVSAACISDCIPEQMGCNGTTIVTKCQLDTDGCYHMLGWQTCNAGYSCSSGSCQLICSNECSAGQIGCNGTSQSWSCGEANDGDTCLDKIYTNCQTGYACSSGSCLLIPPPNPPALSISTAMPQDNTTYSISWTNTGTGYEIQEATNSGFSGAIGWSQAATSKSYIHDVSATTTYYYRVRAINVYGTYSSWSNTVSATIEPYCLAECIPGQMGCLDSTIVSKCQLDTDGCYHMLGWQTCNAGYACSNGSCQMINYPPVISDYYLDSSTNIFYSQVYDSNNDPLTWFNIYLYDVYNSWQFYNYYPLTYYSGDNTASGLWYYADLHFLPEGKYGYFLGISDGINITYEPSSGQLPTFDIVEPLTATLNITPDAVEAGELVSITVQSNKAIGVELGFGDGCGFSYLSFSEPITWTYDKPGIYRIEAEVFDGNTSVLLYGYVVVNTDWNDYSIPADFSLDDLDTYRQELNTSILNNAEDLFGGVQ